MLLKLFFLNARRAAATAVAVAVACAPLAATAQQTPDPSADISFRVSGAAQRLEMVVNTSRILDMPFRVPRLLVQNPDIVRANPISPTKVQISAKKPGVTQLNLWDQDGEVHTIDVVVMGDARELQMLIERLFPNTSIQVRPLNSSAVLTGYVPSADIVNRVVGIAEDYYPKVINNIEVGGAQTVLLHVKVYEVSRTKLRKLGIDWALLNGNVDFVQKGGGNIVTSGLGGTAFRASGETLALGIVSGSDRFFAFIDTLRQNNLAKTLAEPTLVTVSGRPASFQSGGEFPIIVPQSLGTLSVEYRQFGTRVDFVPIVRSNGWLRLEVRPQVSEIDPARSVNINQVNVPGLRNRWVDTAVEMQAGQTLALAGLIQTRLESENKGIPILGELPWVGAAFRRVEEKQNDIELLIMVTPEFVDAMDPHETPPCLPGTMTGSPNDSEFFGRGYLEVPKCNCPPGEGQFQGQPLQESLPAPGDLMQPGDPLDATSAPLAPPVQVAPPVNTDGPLAPAVEGSLSNPAARNLTPPTLDHGFPLSSRQNLGVQPAAANSPLGTQNPQVAPKATSGPGVSTANRTPGYYGPVGYDVLK